MTCLRLGIRPNLVQLSLLAGVTGLVGAMVGLERSILPSLANDEFGIASRSAVLAFVVSFGLAKALANLAAGVAASRGGRRDLLVLGWLLALPVPLAVALAPNWWVIVAANLLLGASQGFAWSMTVLMKVDLAGPRRRGLVLGLNESAGYVGVALAAAASGAMAGSVAPRLVVAVGGAAVVTAGLALAVFAVRETATFAAAEHREGARDRRLDGRLALYAQAGFVNNVNDALVWGLAPLYLAAHGAASAEIGIVAGAYPAVWGAGQLATGLLSDVIGRRPLVVSGMLVQGGALALLAASGGAFAPALAAAVLLGVGTALAYPTLLAAVGDSAAPRQRPVALGRYRFWRDLGLVGGAVVVGVGADLAGAVTTIALVAALTTASGLAFVVDGRRPALR